MNHDTTSKMDLLNSKCDDVIGSMRIKAPLAYKGYTAYASFHPPPSDMDSTNESTFNYDQQYWLPIPSTAKLDRQTVMTKHHFVAEPDWLPPVQTVQHRVPRPHSRGVKLRSVEAIVNDNQRQKAAAAAAALANEEKGQQHATVKMLPRQQQQQQPTPRQPPPPKSKVLDILDEIKAVSRNSSSNSSTPNKFGLTPTTTTPTQNGNMKKQQASIPSKRPSDTPNRQTLKKRTQSSTAPPPPSQQQQQQQQQSSTPNAVAHPHPPTVSTPRSASRPLATEKAPSKTLDVISKSRPKSSDTNLDLFMTKQFLINDLNDPAATRHLEDLSSLNVIRKRPVLRVHIKVKLPKIKNESRSKEIYTKQKNDTQPSPVVTGDASSFNLPTGTIPTEFIRSMKIRKKSKSDQAAATPSSPMTAPPPTTTTTTTTTSKPVKSHTIELEEGETISPSPSPRRHPSLSPERNTTKASSSKRHRDNNGMDDHDHQKQSRRNKVSRKDVSVPLSSSSSSASSSTSTTSRNINAHDNGDDRQRHGSSPTTTATSSKSLVRKDRYSNSNSSSSATLEEDRKSGSSKRLERTISSSGGDDDRRRSKYNNSSSSTTTTTTTSSSRHSRDDDISSRHRSSQRSSGSSRQRRSSRSISRSRSPNRRSSSSSSHTTRSSSQDKHRRHVPTTTTTTTATASSLSSSSSSSSSAAAAANKDRSSIVLNRPTTPTKDVRLKDSVPTPTAAFLSPAIQAIKKEPKESIASSSSTSSTSSSSSSSSPMARKEPISVPSPVTKKESRDSTRSIATTATTTKSTSSTQRIYPPATAEDAETHDQYRIFFKMFNKLALTYKRRGDHPETEVNGVLDHMHAFMNYILTFYFQDKVHSDQVDKSWGTLPPFTGAILQKLQKLKHKEKQYDTLYGLCLRMNALVHFYIFHRREQFAKPKLARLCEKRQDQADGLDEAKRIEYGQGVHKVLQDYETAYSTLRESDRYLPFEVIQLKFPLSFDNVCVRGEMGAGIVVGGEAGVAVGPMFPLVPYARLHHAAIMAKCLLQEFVDKEGIDYHPITKTEDYM